MTSFMNNPLPNLSVESPVSSSENLTSDKDDFRIKIGVTQAIVIATTRISRTTGTIRIVIFDWSQLLLQDILKGRFYTILQAFGLIKKVTFNL